MSIRSFRFRRHASRLLLVAAVAAAFSTSNSALAANGTWNANANANWSDTTRWTSGNVADGAGFTASFTGANLTGADKTVTLDTSRVIGKINIGDNSSSDNRSYVIAAAAGMTLTFNNNGSAATLTQTASSNGDRITAPVILVDSLSITNNHTSKALTLSGVISTTAGKGLTVAGNTGGVILSGANTFDGGVTLTSGELYLNNAGSGGTSSALGTGTLTINGGSIGSTAGSAVTISTNNIQAWNADFTFEGTQSLNLGTGAVTLSANRTISLGSTSDTLTIGGVISDGGSAFSLNTANTTGVVTGILGLSGANTYTGGTNINGGVVRFNNGNAIPATGTITVQTDGALSISGAHSTPATWLADSHLSTASTGALSLAGASSDPFDPGATGHNTLSLGANVGGNFAYTGLYTPSSAGYFVGGGGGTLTLSNANTLTGTNNVTVGNGGGGTVTLSNSNDYTGTTTITNGTLQLTGTAGALGTGSVEVQAGGVLSFARTNNYTLAAGNVITGAGTVLVHSGTATAAVDGQFDTTGQLLFGNADNSTSTGTLDLTNANATFGSLNVQTNTATANTITIGPTKTLTIEGNVQIGTNRNSSTTTALTADGGGTLTVDNAATNGVFNVGGVLTSTNAGIGNNATADFSGLGALNINLSASSGTVRVNPTSGANLSGKYSTFVLPSTGAGNTTITANQLNIGDSVENGGVATPPNRNTLKLGTGTNALNVNTINIGTGTRDIGSLEFNTTAGTLKIRDATNAAAGGAAHEDSRTALNIGAIGGGTGVNAASGNIFDVRGHDVDMRFSSVNIGTQNRGIGTLLSTFGFDIGTLDLTTLTVGRRSGIPGTGTPTGTAADAKTISNIYLGSSGSTGSVKIANAVALSEITSGVNADFYSVDSLLEVAGGTVEIGNTSGTSIKMAANAANASLTTLASTATVNLTGGVTTLSGDIIKVGGTGAISTASLTLNGGTLIMSSTTNNNIGSAASKIDNLKFQSGTLQGVGTINGTEGLDKTTAGTLTLAGTNTYTGATTVTEGKLVVNGSITSETSVSALGTLAGNGSITGNVTSNGLVAPGNSIGTLTVLGDATFNAGSTFEAELGAGNLSDLLNLTSLGSNLSLATTTDTLSLLSTLDPGTFTIIDYNGTRAGGIFDQVSFNGASQTLVSSTIGAVNPAGFTGTGDLYNYGAFSVFYNDSGASVQVAVTAIPEPSTLLLGGIVLLGGAGVGLRRRRSQK